MATVFEAKRKALQQGKGAICRFEEFVEVGICPFKGDPAHAIAMFKYSTHAPKGTAGDVSIPASVVDENRQRT
jgi:hypothetical protein